MATKEEIDQSYRDCCVTLHCKYCWKEVRWYAGACWGLTSKQALEIHEKECSENLFDCLND